jgi:diacylglycerol kinase (ATP)
MSEMQPQPHIIINPASAGGRTRARMESIIEMLTSHLRERPVVHVTEKPLEGIHMAASAVSNGARLLIIVGGDGTIHEVVNGLFSNGHLRNPQCDIGIISSGSGCGFAQSLSLPFSLDDQVECIVSGTSRQVDVGKVTFKNPEGRNDSRYFINECQVGLGAEVVRRVQSGHKKLGGRLAFALGALQTIFTHKNKRMRVVVDEKTIIDDELTGITVGNGAFMGGGMNLVPGAHLDDGVFDILVMHRLSLLLRLLSFPFIYSGNHTRLKRFSIHRGRMIQIVSEHSLLVAADGELLGTTPCSIKLLPSVLPVRFKKGSSSQ